MHIALKGLLVGIAVAAVLLLFEYTMAQKSSRERGKKMARTPELNQDERARLRSMVRFSFILPPLFAAIFWLTMG